MSDSPKVNTYPRGHFAEELAKRLTGIEGLDPVPARKIKQSAINWAIKQYESQQKLIADFEAKLEQSVAEAPSLKHDIIHND